jgi:hypothetical protein
MIGGTIKVGITETDGAIVGIADIGITIIGS